MIYQKFKHVNKQFIYYPAMYTPVLNCAANLIDFLHVQVLYLLDDCRKLDIEYLKNVIYLISIYKNSI